MSHRSTVAQSKQAERHVAALLGGRRLHAGEWYGGGDVDVVSEREGDWVAQVKQRKDVAGYIQEGMRQLDEVRDAMPLKLLVIVTKPGSGKTSETYVMMRVSEWTRMQSDDGVSALGKRIKKITENTDAGSTEL